MWMNSWMNIFLLYFLLREAKSVVFMAAEFIFVSQARIFINQNNENELLKASEVVAAAFVLKKKK